MSGRVAVVIIGGGMVGLACAWHCRERGLTVTLIDPGDPRAAASFGNAGVISRGSILPLAGPGIWKKLGAYALNRDPGVRIGYAALPRLLPWITTFLRSCTEAHLRAAAAALDPLCAAAYDTHWAVAGEIGARHLIQRRGWMKLYRSEAVFSASALERDLLRTHRVGTEVLDGQEIQQAEPALIRSYAKALLFTETGSVHDPGALVAAWREACRSRGATFHEDTARRIDVGSDGVDIRTARGVVRAKTAVVATGAATPELLRPLGIAIPFAAERGYHKHFRAVGDHALTRPVYDTGGPLIMAPMAAGIRITTGIELTDRWAPPNTAQIIAMEKEARAAIALGESVEAAPWFGSRPSTSDGLPVIGRSMRYPNLVFAFGHGHIGLSTGPVTGKLVAEIITNATPSVPIAPFAAERF